MKISKTSKGRKNPGQKRKPMSDATKMKIGEKNKISHKGKKLSIETRKRISQSIKEHWKARRSSDLGGI